MQEKWRDWATPASRTWTVTRSSLRVLRRVAAFYRPLRPVFLLVSFPRSWSPVVGMPWLCWLWHGVPFARQCMPSNCNTSHVLRATCALVAVHKGGQNFAWQDFERTTSHDC